MGKRKKEVIALFLLALILGFLTWRIALPSWEKFRLTRWLKNEFGYTLQMENLHLSFLGSTGKIKNALLIDPNVIEHPILSIEELSYRRSFSKIRLRRPKLTFTRSKPGELEKFTRIGRWLRGRSGEIAVQSGEIEIWDKLPFEGTPVHLAQANLRFYFDKTAVKISGAAAIPSGIKGLAPFFPAAKDFLDKKLLLTAQITLPASGGGDAQNIELTEDEKTLFAAARIAWEKKENNLRFLLEKPVFDVERTQGGRWRCTGFFSKSLFALEKEVRHRFGNPGLDLRLTGATVHFSDKSVFPLFTTVLYPVDLTLKPENEIWGWQAEIGLKDFPESKITLAGAYSGQFSAADTRAEFANLPAAPLFPYYHRQIPYEKLEGTFSGSCTDGNLRLILNGPWGTPQPDRDDKLKELTGTSTAEWLKRLQNAEGMVELDLPFTWEWEKPLAEHLLSLYPKKTEKK